ncbi:Uncharacterised protein [Mycobacterium tuberculosis]|nr:Uncharacterised protein [Mycobacterium tuberculosis]
MYSEAPPSAAPSVSMGSTEAAPAMSISSGAMSRMVCAWATRPKMPGVDNAASRRAALRPNRYATDPSSISRAPLGSGRVTLAATASTAADMNPA